MNLVSKNKMNMEVSQKMKKLLKWEKIQASARKVRSRLKKIKRAKNVLNQLHAKQLASQHAMQIVLFFDGRIH